MEEARRALRRHRRNTSELAWQEYLEACKARRAAISKAKRWSYEEAIENASKERGKSFWRLAKWAKSKSFLPLSPPSIPSLTTPQGKATTPEAKCEALKAWFFPPTPLLISQTSLTSNTLLKNFLPQLSPLMKLPLLYPRLIPTRPQARWAADVFSYAPWQALASISSTSFPSLPTFFLPPSPFQIVYHYCLNEARERELLCPCCLAACCTPRLPRKVPRSCGCKQNHCPLREAWPIAPTADGSPPSEVY